MSDASGSPPADTPPATDGAPRRAIRRWGDACYHQVDEEVEEGFILRGILIPHDEVVDVIDLEANRKKGSDPFSE